MNHKIVTLGGSNSRKSINKTLAEFAGNQLKNIDIINIDLNDYEIPLYSVDVETEHGFPKSVSDLNTVLKNADGFIVSLAEHNGAYSAAFKNAYDWLSRVETKVWRNKPMLLLSTSPGARGGQSVFGLASNTFSRMGANIVGSMTFPSFYDNFKEGEISNPELKSKLLGLVDKFEKSIE